MVSRVEDETMPPFESKSVGEKVDAVAPDGSEIRLLPELAGGSMVHCQLPIGLSSQAVSHHRVEELWYILAGTGELWRKQGEKEEITVLEAGLSLSIPLGTIFQFRNTGDRPLELIIVTMPPWTGSHEAILEENHWER